MLHTLRMSLILPAWGLQSGDEGRGCNVPVRNVSALRMLPLKTREGGGRKLLSEDLARASGTASHT